MAKTEPTIEELEVIAKIRMILGVGHNPMMEELPGIVRRIVQERNALLANTLAYRKHCRESLAAGPTGDPKKHIEIDKRFDEIVAEHDRKVGIAVLNGYILCQESEDQKGGAK